MDTIATSTIKLKVRGKEILISKKINTIMRAIELRK
jgi:hypothetical protein